MFQIEIRSSKLLTCLTLWIYITIFFGILLLSRYFLTTVLIIFVGAHAYWIIRKICLCLSNTSIVLCQHFSSDIWRLTNRAGNSFSVKLICHFRSRWFTTLIFKTIPYKKSMMVTIAYDALPKQNYTLLLSRLWNSL